MALPFQPELVFWPPGDCKYTPACSQGRGVVVECSTFPFRIADPAKAGRDDIVGGRSQETDPPTPRLRRAGVRSASRDCEGASTKSRKETMICYMANDPTGKSRVREPGRSGITTEAFCQQVSPVGTPSRSRLGLNLQTHVPQRGSPKAPQIGTANLPWLPDAHGSGGSWTQPKENSGLASIQERIVWPCWKLNMEIPIKQPCKMHRPWILPWTLRMAGLWLGQFIARPIYSSMMRVNGR